MAGPRSYRANAGTGVSARRVKHHHRTRVGQPVHRRRDHASWGLLRYRPLLGATPQHFDGHRHRTTLCVDVPGEAQGARVGLAVGHGSGNSLRHQGRLLRLIRRVSVRVQRVIKMPQYRIRYKDSRSHTVEADSYQYRDRVNQYEFMRDDQKILTVSADSVESVGLADIPDAEPPEWEVGELRR